MATGRVEFPKIRSVNQTPRRANSYTDGDDVEGQHRSRIIAGLLVDAPLISRLPSTISSDVVQDGAPRTNVTGDDGGGRERGRNPGRGRRLSHQLELAARSINKQQFVRRLSSRNSALIPSQTRELSNIPHTITEDQTPENGEAPARRERRLVKRASSFQLQSLMNSMRKSRSNSDAHGEKFGLRRSSSIVNEGNVELDTAVTRSLPNLRTSTLSKQLSLLSMQSDSSTASSLVDVGVEFDGRHNRRRRSRKLSSCNNKRNSRHLSGTSSRISGGGRHSRRVLRRQLKAIATSSHMVNDRFRKAARLLQMVIRSFQIGRHNGQGRSYVTGSVELASPRPSIVSEIGSFDPSRFKARREGQLTSEAKQILSKEIDDRTPDEINKVLVSLRTALDVFCEFPVKMQRSLAKFGFYSKLERRRVIVRQGHRAENFFLVLSGMAIVTMTTRSERSEETRARLVNCLRMGNTFGEREIMENERRPYTVVCHEEMELLTIDKEHYVNLFMSKSEDDPEAHGGISACLRKIDVFRNWPIDKLPRDNPSVCLLTYFRKGVVICRNSNESEWIYVIKSGACTVLKTLDEPKSTHTTHTRYVTKQHPQPRNKKLKNRRRLPPIISVTSDDASSVPGSSSPSCGEGSRGGGEGPEMSTGSKARVRFANAARSVFSTEVRLQKEMKSIADAEDHISLLDNISIRSGARSPRLADLTMSLMENFLSDSGSTSTRSTEKKSVVIKLRRCEPGDVFDLAPLLFMGIDGSPGLTLTSEGAECIMISKSFFLQHLSESEKNRLLRTVPPWPGEGRLQELLQQHVDWDKYKADIMEDIVQFNQRVTEGSI